MIGFWSVLNPEVQEHTHTMLQWQWMKLTVKRLSKVFTLDVTFYCALGRLGLSATTMGLKGSVVNQLFSGFEIPQTYECVVHDLWTEKNVWHAQHGELTVYNRNFFVKDLSAWTDWACQQWNVIDTGMEAVIDSILLFCFRLSPGLHSPLKEPVQLLWSSLFPSNWSEFQALVM
jgi:hypothetical protein